MVVTRGCNQNAVTLASIIFKNTVVAGQSWLQIIEQTRGQIKEGLLQLLGSEEKWRVKAASLCMAAVASIEIPELLWDNFLELIAQTAI